MDALAQVTAAIDWIRHYWAAILVGVGMAAFFGFIFYLIDWEATEARDIKTKCLALGYPEYQAIGQLHERRYFCQKRVLGSDELHEVRP